MVFIASVVSMVAGICVGFLAAAFVAGQSRPCPHCAGRESRVPYKVEADHRAVKGSAEDVLIREALGQYGKGSQ